MKTSLKALGLLYLLRTNGSMTLHQIMELCNDGRDAVKTALQELRNKGLVKMEKVRSAGRLESFLYSLTTSGKSVSGNTSNGKSINGETLVNTGFFDFRHSPVAENPSVVTPLVENQPVVENIENQSFAPTSDGKSGSGAENNASLSIINKGSNKSKYIGNTTLRVEDNSVKKKEQKRKAKAPQVLFRETEFVMLEDGRERFRAALIGRNSAYEMADTDYYYERALNWSDNDNRKVNWVATVANWITDDVSRNKLVKSKTNSHDKTGGKNWNAVTDADIERAQRLADRFGWELGG